MGVVPGVVSLAAARIEREPHLSGLAVCLACRHEWQAVAPVGTLALECPSCSLAKGAFFNMTRPDGFWECNCGCSHMAVTRTEVVCLHCGVTQEFPNPSKV